MENYRYKDYALSMIEQYSTPPMIHWVWVQQITFLDHR